jgi:hypothetical protein
LDFGGELFVTAAADEAQFDAGNGVAEFSAFDEFGGGFSFDLGMRDPG